MYNIFSYDVFSVHVHVVHVSSAAVIPILEKARAERILAGNKEWRGGVTAETCHHYLTLISDQIPPGHTEYKCSPPIRNNTNRVYRYIYYYYIFIYIICKYIFLQLITDRLFIKPQT